MTPEQIATKIINSCHSQKVAHGAFSEILIKELEKQKSHWIKEGQNQILQNKKYLIGSLKKKIAELNRTLIRLEND